MQPASWPTLAIEGLEKSALRERRAAEVEDKRVRDAAAKEDAQAKRNENERKAVRVQMKVDEEEHATLDSYKEEEKRKAEEETYRVLESLKQDNGAAQRPQKKPPAPQQQDAASANKPPPAAAERADKRAASKPETTAVPVDDDDIDDSGIMQELEHRTQAQQATLPAAQTEIWQEGDLAPHGAEIDSGHSHTDLAATDQEDDDAVFVPQPRQTGGVVKISFTKRFFKTPLRESKRAEEEDWIAKNQRGLSNHPEARDIAERDPFWLKGKGDDFFKAKDFKGAVNAYSAALQAQPTMFAALSNRAAACLALRRFDECISDATAAMEVVKSETESRAKCLKLWVRRGTALCGKGQYDQALEDYDRVLKQCPNDPKIQNDIRTIQRLKQCSAIKKEADDLFRAQKMEEACAKYSEALDVDSGFVSCYTNRAATHLALQHYAECAADASAALVLMGIEDAHDDRNKNQDDSLARPVEKNACVGPVPAEGTPKYAAWLVNIYVKRGVARAQLGDLSNAIADYEAAFTAQPSNKQVKRDLSRLRKRAKESST